METTLFPIEIKRERRKYQRPELAIGSTIISWANLSSMLPAKAYLEGCILREIEFIGSVDPVILYNRAGKVKYEWEYIPSLAELNDVCQNLGLR